MMASNGSEKCSSCDYQEEDGDLKKSEPDYPALIQPTINIDEAGEAEESASVIVENIVEEIVSFVASKSFSLGSELDSKTSGDEGDGTMMMQTVPGEPPALQFPLDGGDAENTVMNFDLDVDGNYIPPPGGSSLKDSSSSQSINSSDEERANDHHERQEGSEDPQGTGNDDLDLDTDFIIQIRMLIDENKSLQQQLAKMKRVLAFVMSKYRNSVTFLLNEMDVYKSDFQKLVGALKETGGNYDPKMEVYKLNATIAEMKEVMFNAAKLDDSTMNLYEEKVAQLRHENQGLRNLIRVAYEYGGECRSTSVDASTQTEEISEQAIVEEELEAIIIAKRSESLDVYGTSYEHEDDMESFHTANSPDGSLPSLNQEPDGTRAPSPIAELELPTIIPTGNPGLIGDQDKVVFDEEQVNSVLSTVVSK